MNKKWYMIYGINTMYQKMHKKHKKMVHDHVPKFHKKRAKNGT